MICRNMSYSQNGGLDIYLNYYRYELFRRCDDQCVIAIKLSQMFNLIPRLVKLSDPKITLPINASHTLPFVPVVRPCKKYVYKNKEFSDQ